MCSHVWLLCVLLGTMWKEIPLVGVMPCFFVVPVWPYLKSSPKSHPLRGFCDFLVQSCRVDEPTCWRDWVFRLESHAMHQYVPLSQFRFWFNQLASWSCWLFAFVFRGFCRLCFVFASTGWCRLPLFAGVCCFLFWLAFVGTWCWGLYLPSLLLQHSLLKNGNQAPKANLLRLPCQMFWQDVSVKNLNEFKT